MKLGSRIEDRAYDIWRDAIHAYIDNTAYRNFYLWAISFDNPHRREFMECLGFHQIVNLFDAVTAGLFTGEAADRVVEALALMTVQQVFEVNSDSLAIGLGKHRSRWSPEDYQREWLQRVFNQAMRSRIQSPVPDAWELLCKYRAQFEQISLFKQSLTFQKQQRSARAYIKREQQTDAILSQIEYATYGPLVAHIELTAKMVEALRGSPIFDLFVDGLNCRYNGVDDALLHFAYNIDERSAIGRDTILIIPTIAFFIGMAYEQTGDTADAIRMATDSGLMEDLLGHIAVLIRLLNDVGTPLLESDDIEIEHFIATLDEAYETSNVPFMKFLCEFAPENRYLARVEKDLIFGETNILLDGCRYATSDEQAKAQFIQEIHACRTIYAQHQAQYADLRARAHDELPSTEFLTPAHRVLYFHQKLYADSFWTQAGEYNI